MTMFHEDRDAAIRAAEKLKLFAQPQRLMILSCLLLGERSVGEIADATGIVQPALSQQLAELRRAELVRTRRAAKQVCYALADPGVELCVRTMETLLVGAEATLPAISAATPVLAPRPRPSGPRATTPDGVASFARLI